MLDDNAHMRSLMRAILSSFGVRNVEEAANVWEGFEVMARQKVDVAFVDYRLGDLDGAEFVRRVRNDEESSDPFLPIIMITAYSERSRVYQAINAGVDEFLVKPIRAVDVASRINAIIERRRPFVRSPDFFGPDRRRKKDTRYKGPWRRIEDPGTFSI
ncbi:MAG: response regulator [Hyphomonadaceae bacterium]